MSGKDNNYPTNGPNKDTNPPEVHLNKGNSTDKRLDEVEDNPAKILASESEADSDVEIEPVESINKLQQTITQICTSNANCELEYVIARSKQDEVQFKKEAQL